MIDDNEKIDANDYIFNYIHKIINRINLNQEELIKEIHKISEEIIKKLKEKEEKCKLNARTFEKFRFEKLKSNSLASWKHSLRSPDLKEQELNDLLAKINEKKMLVQNTTKKLKSDLLMNEGIHFEKHEKSSTFGRILFYSNKYKN